MKYLDQADADKHAIGFIEEAAKEFLKTAPTGYQIKIEWRNHENSDGRTGLLWVGEELAAVTVVARDGYNRSDLVTHSVFGFISEDGIDDDDEFDEWAEDESWFGHLPHSIPILINYFLPPPLGVGVGVGVGGIIAGSVYSSSTK